MKRLSNSPESLSALMSICPNSTDEESNPMYGQDLQAMLESMEEEGSGPLIVEKKRRLSVDQVRALEKNFEVENKLEPERKVKLAQDLGLQPRQVAVWFQNRRARWKTKQLEKDYGVLKASYDELELSFERLQHENEALLKEIGELKSKLNEDTNSETTTKNCVKEEEASAIMASDTEEDDQKPHLDLRQAPISELINSSGENHSESTLFGQQQQIPSVSIFFSDGSSDSDSSAILNDDTDNNNNNNNSHSPTAAVSSSNGILKNSSVICSMGFQVSDYKQLVKIEDQDLFGEEEMETCSGFMFGEDQAPSLNWYSSDEWNGIN